MDPISRDRRIKAIYKELATMTKCSCMGTCTEVKDNCEVAAHLPIHRCCERIWCAHSLNWARAVWNQSPKPVPHADRIHHSIPYLAKDGCVLEPHLRPICSVHACQIERRGYFADEQVNEKYWTLRSELDKLEVQRAKAKKIDLIAEMAKEPPHD